MRTRLLVGLSTVLAVVGGSAAAAFATPYDPTSDVTSLGTSAASTMGPIIVALAGAILGLAVLSWGIRAVFRAISSGGRHV